MIKYCKEKWNANKEKLEAVLRNDTHLNDCDYMYLLKLTVENILNTGIDTFTERDRLSVENITEVDNGDYQGTLLFLIPYDCYQPNEMEYLMTFIDYGSCSGCDTLMGIQDYGEKPPTEDQVKEYMMLCKDMIMNMIKPYNYGWRYNKKYEVVEEIKE